jgi:cell division protein FtsW
MTVLGLVMIFSSSFVYAQKYYHDSFYFFKKQLVAFVLALIALFFFLKIPYQLYEKYSPFILLLGFFVLLVIFVPGLRHSGGGATRWLRILGFSFQTSEIAKLSFLIFLAAALSEGKKHKDEEEYLIFIFYVILGVYVVYSFLIYIQPNLSNVILLGMVMFLVVFVGDVSLYHISFTILMFISSGVFFALQKSYRLRRLKAFLNPNLDPYDTGYQITQSLIAIGSGGFLGRGLGKSVQKYFYLPAQHTDFIFSVIAEELGFLGGAMLILLYAIILWRGVKIALTAPDYFSRYLSFGITAMITLQAAINLGVVTSILPTTGLPLPFVSYGGSSLIANYIAIGILLNISRSCEKLNEDGNEKKKRRLAIWVKKGF